MIRIAIVEDESESALRLQSFVEDYGRKQGEKLSVAVFENGMEFVENYTSSIDIIFMDIEMPFLNGMDAAKKIREIDQIVCLIFVTQMVQFAVKGYEVDAMDFIVKPIDYFNISLKLKKAIQYVKSINTDDLLFQFKTGFRRVNVADIRYIEVLGHNLVYHLVDGDYELRGTMKIMEEQLLRYSFSRCSNSYLINLKHVQALNQHSIKIGQDELQISRSKKKNFLNDLTKYLGGIYK